jgi:uncharacterized protein YegJ (DUF2314 family)
MAKKRGNNDPNDVNFDDGKRRGRPPKAVSASTSFAAATAAPAASAKPALAAEKASLVLDYPLEGEIVTSHSYCIRVTAQEPRSVEICLDGKRWFSCRESVGHWWYDWSGFRSGGYTITARMTDKNGKVSKTKDRQFTVLI